jgi:hypothetical protein
MHVFCVGDLRGAAMVFNVIALDNPARVKAAVLESIFDSVSHALKHLIYSDSEARTEERLDNALCAKIESRLFPTPILVRVHYA